MLSHWESQHCRPAATARALARPYWLLSMIIFSLSTRTAVIVRLAGTDGAGCLHRGDEDPSVAHAAGPSGNFDSLDRIADAVVIHDHPDPALSGWLPQYQI
jgi:hypothetical protein